MNVLVIYIMVESILKCYNFSCQDVVGLEADVEPQGLTITQNDLLLIPTSQHLVEVRDLNHKAKLLHTFPTADTVLQLHHSNHGKYNLSREAGPKRVPAFPCI